MKPYSAAVVGLSALLALAPIQSVLAQEDPGSEMPSSPDIASPEVELEPVNPFLPGDQTIGLTVGLQLPLFILPDTRAVIEPKLDLGGSFSFSYQYFIYRGIAIGGTIGGAFNSSIGDQSLFVAPLSFRGAYWWTLGSFEFDVGAEVGGYLLRLGDDGVLGPFAKLGGGAFWNSASSWSIGLQSYFWLVPELHVGDYSDLTRTSGFLEVALAAVYHL